MGIPYSESALPVDDSLLQLLNDRRLKGGHEGLALGSRGLRLTSSPIQYDGNDLQIAENVVVDRAGNTEGLTKRPGLKPFGVDLGAAVTGMITVPLEDPLARATLLYAPTTTIADPNKYVGWQPPEEVYPLRRAAAVASQVYYASDTFDLGVSPPSLHVFPGDTAIFAPHRADGSITDVITCVRNLQLGDGAPVVYVATAKFGSTSTDIDLFRLDAASGDMEAVRPSLTVSGAAVVVDLVGRNGRLLALVAGATNAAYSIDAARSREAAADSWQLEFSSPMAMVSAAADSTGNVYIGTSNRLDDTQPALILRFSPAGGEPAVSFTSEGNGRTFFAALAQYRGNIYAIEHRADHPTIFAHRFSEGIWSLDGDAITAINEDDERVGLFPNARHVGQSAVVDGNLYVVMPSPVATEGAVLRRNVSTWTVHFSGRAYQGPVAGTVVG